MRRLRDKGVAVILITHKLREAYEFGDCVSVLRLGRLVGEIRAEPLKTMSEAQATDAVIRMMFGTLAEHEGDAEALAGPSKGQKPGRSIDRSGKPRLSARALSTTAARGERAISDVSFDLWPGEVLGIAGIDGNGQKHLAEALAGQREANVGRIEFMGVEVTAQGVAERRARGIRYVTDERLGEGTVGPFSVAANLVLKEIGSEPFWRKGLSDWDRIHAHAREKIEKHDIRAPSERTPIARLSGGNIQKVLLAREADIAEGVIIFNKPTHGLDLHNTRLARDRIVAAAQAGLAVLVISTDLDELLEVSDRIGVMYQGHLAGVVENGADVERKVGALMTGAQAA
jgi:simple sugar transport system ATP-binding protein